MASRVWLATALAAAACHPSSSDAPPPPDARSLSDSSSDSGSKSVSASETGPESTPESGSTSPARAFVCFPPVAHDFERCPKGTARDEATLAACRRREATEPRGAPTFRVGARSSTFSRTRWRCGAVAPDAPVHVTIDTLAGLDVVVPSSCASRAMDMDGPNFYGAIVFRCSRRSRADDEVVEW